MRVAMWCLKTHDGPAIYRFPDKNELYGFILDEFSNEGMNPIDELWGELEDGRRIEMTAEWFVAVMPAIPAPPQAQPAEERSEE